MKYKVVIRYKHRDGRPDRINEVVRGKKGTDEFVIFIEKWLKQAGRTLVETTIEEVA